MSVVIRRCYPTQGPELSVQSNRSSASSVTLSIAPNGTHGRQILSLLPREAKLLSRLLAEACKDLDE
jgi:hypothetical protein